MGHFGLHLENFVAVTLPPPRVPSDAVRFGARPINPNAGPALDGQRAYQNLLSATEATVGRRGNPSVPGALCPVPRIKTAAPAPEKKWQAAAGPRQVNEM